MNIHRAKAAPALKVELTAALEVQDLARITRGCHLQAQALGGDDRSGIGRESGIVAGRDYLETKSVRIATETSAPNPFVIR